MPGTRPKWIFEQLKKIFSLKDIWEIVLIPQYYLIKSFGDPTTKLKIAPKGFGRLSQFCNNFRTLTLNNNNKKILKLLIAFVSYD